jgi:hypothetical protein
MATAALAFAIAAAALTIPELISGGSITGDRQTTLFGGRHHAKPTTTEELQPGAQGQPQEGQQGTAATTTERTTTQKQQRQQTEQTTTGQTTTGQQGGSAQPSP